MRLNKLLQPVVRFIFAITVAISLCSCTSTYYNVENLPRTPVPPRTTWNRPEFALGNVSISDPNAYQIADKVRQILLSASTKSIKTHIQAQPTSTVDVQITYSIRHKWVLRLGTFIVQLAFLGMTPMNDNEYEQFSVTLSAMKDGQQIFSDTSPNYFTHLKEYFHLHPVGYLFHHAMIDPVTEDTCYSYNLTQPFRIRSSPNANGYTAIRHKEPHGIMSRVIIDMINRLVIPQAQNPDNQQSIEGIYPVPEPPPPPPIPIPEPRRAPPAPRIHMK